MTLRTYLLSALAIIALAGCGGNTESKSRPPLTNQENMPNPGSTVFIKKGRNSMFLGWDLDGNGTIDEAVKTWGVSYNSSGVVTIAHSMLRDHPDKLKYFVAPGFSPSQRFLNPLDGTPIMPLEGKLRATLNAAYEHVDGN